MPSQLSVKGEELIQVGRSRGFQKDAVFYLILLLNQEESILVSASVSSPPSGVDSGLPERRV